MGKEKKVLEDRNIRYDVAIIYLLEVLFVDSQAALPPLNNWQSSEAANLNCDHSSSK